MKRAILGIVALLSTSSAFEVAPVTDESMKSGCVDCHFVYQAEFLPKASWEKMFEEEELADHFGDKVELSSGLKSKFLAYYLENASDVKNIKVTRKINRSLPKNRTLLRVSKVPYIMSQHEDLDREMFIDNPKVKSYANCNACHNAEDGEYDEDDVDVPGWEKGFFFGWSRK